jgi:hypothetical protein
MAEKDAFCLLLWVHQGGRVDEKGRPVRVRGVRASGNCDAPDDCYRCQLMQQEISRHPPGHAIWVCPDCIGDVVKVAKGKEVSYYLAGHYTEGQCQYMGCVRPPRLEYDEAAESIVEKPRGYSRFLQLFIGDVNS